MTEDYIPVAKGIMEIAIIMARFPTLHTEVDVAMGRAGRVPGDAGVAARVAELS